MSAQQGSSTVTQAVSGEGYRPLIDMIWPASGSTMMSVLRAIVLMAAGTALIAVCAKIKVDLPYVPMTMQTLAVLAIALTYGARLGTLTLLAYIGEGLVGLPVFAGATAGPAYMMGPTAGFLAGFVVAAAVVGIMAEYGFDRTFLRAFAATTVGHIIILAMGFGWLAFGLHLGVEKAWLAGVYPFIAGSLVKNALAAVIVPGARFALARRT